MYYFVHTVLIWTVYYMDQYTGLSPCIVQCRPLKENGISGYRWHSSISSYLLTKELVVLCVICFCHIEREFFPLLGCYAMCMSSYWYFRTSVCPNFKGQAVQAWLILHISTDWVSWTVKYKAYIWLSYYWPDIFNEVTQ